MRILKICSTTSNSHKGPRNNKLLGPLLMMGLCWAGLSLPAWADAPLGNYRCTGKSPGQNQEYKGQVEVSKSGDNYTVLWRLGTKVYLGTGLDLGDTFAVAFLTEDRQWFGLAVFRKQNNQWVGKWASAGSKVFGTETWTPL